MSDDTEVAERKEINPKIKSYVDPKKAHKDAQVGSDIQDAFMNQASLYIHYGQLAAHASYQVDQIKQLLEVVKSRIDRELRDAAVDAGEKITEAMLEKRIANHPTVIRVTKALNEARFQERLAKVAVEGMAHRKDMLVQIGAHDRTEREGELRLMSRSSREEEAQALRERAKKRLAAAE